MNRDNDTPLEYAIHFRNPKVIDFLIKNGAKFTDNMVLRIRENEPTDKIVQKIKSLSPDQINAVSTGAGKRKYLKYKEKYLQLKNQLN